MHLADILEYIFDDAAANATVFSDTTDETDAATDEAISRLNNACIDLVIGDLLYGVVNPTLPAEHATFSMVRGERAVPVFLLNEPISADDADETDILALPAPAAGWTFCDGSDRFFTPSELEDLANATATSDASADGTDDDDSDLQHEPDAVESVPVHEDLDDFKEDDLACEAVAGHAAEPVPDSGGAGSGETGTDQPVYDEYLDESAGGPATAPAAAAHDSAAAGSQSTGTAAEEAAVFWNDAELIGQPTPEMEALLDQSCTFMIGELYPGGGGRNTPDGKWKPVTMPLRAWIEGGGKGNRADPAWGLSRHPVGKMKDGSSLVFAETIGGSREKASVKTHYAIGLDIDSGTDLDTVLDRLEAQNIFAIVYTSFNHLKTRTVLKRDAVLRKLKIERDPTDAEVRQYLLHHHDKDRFDEAFIAQVRIAEQQKETKKGIVIEVEHPPLHKFRVIFPLAEPVSVKDIAPTQARAHEIWGDKVIGVAKNILDVTVDVTCTDPSRLFYTPRHPKDAEWYAAVVQGAPLRFDEIESYSKDKYTRRRGDADNPFLAAGGDDDRERLPQCYAPSGMSLNEWHRLAKGRSLMADLLEAECPEKVVHTGGATQGKVHVECPFEHEHSEPGGTACMAINCLDSQSEFWTWLCHHSSCSNKHKLEFLEQALKDEWFDEELLKDDAYLLPAEDGEEEEAETDEETSGLVLERHLTPEERAGKLGSDCSDADVQALLLQFLNEGIDVSARERAMVVLAKNTPLGKRALTKMWRDLEKEEKQKQRALEKADISKLKGTPLVNELDFHDLCEYGRIRLKTMNDRDPWLFHYMENLVVIREDANGNAKIRFLGIDGFSHELNTVARFARTVGDDSRIGVAAPMDVVRFLFNADYGVYPTLRGVVTSPTFSAEGKLIKNEGYDVNSKLYYQPRADLILPDVPEKPTGEQLEAAKRLLIEEVFADFPLGRRTRPEIVAEGLDGDGIPALTNLFALTLLPFMREMIDGPTPGHLLTKPAPGTGASLLTDVVSIIATGQPTPALSLPSGREEMSKTLTSVLANGQQIVFFDNINANVDSGELASAMTAPTYQARVLGKTQTVETEVRCAWVLTGNNVKLSNELLRRLVMIELDAQAANPEMRTSFRHRDIRGWATEHRGNLVAACLTIIQYWISKGAPHNMDVSMASYENWARVMGGVLHTAGLDGFLANQAELRDLASDEEDDEILSFVESWWQDYDTTPVPVRTDKGPNLIALAISTDAQLPQVRLRTDLKDGEKTIDPKSFGKFLGKQRHRVFRLESGVEVILDRNPARSKHGHLWQLSLKTAAPESNIV